MDDKLKFAGMLLGGYLLGRTKKMRLALMLATGLGARQLRRTPRRSPGQLSSVMASPEVRRLTEELTIRLTDAGRAAAFAAVTKGVESLTANLEHRTEKLTTPVQEGAKAAAGKATSAAGTATSAAGTAAGTATGTAEKATSSLKDRMHFGKKKAEAPAEE